MNQTVKFAIKVCPLCGRQLKLSYSSHSQKYYCPSSLIFNITESHYYIEFNTNTTPTQSIIINNFRLINTLGKSNIYILPEDKLVLTCDTLPLINPDKLIKKIKFLIPFA